MMKQSKSSPNQDDPYDVGYCKPPKHTQFPPGQSGNPKGRPPGRQNMRTIVRDAMQEPVSITENGRKRKVQKIGAVIRVAINKALKGDPKAITSTLQFARSAGLLDEETDVLAHQVSSADDQAILDAHLARHGVNPETLCDLDQVSDASDISADDADQAAKKQKTEDQS